MQTADMLKSAGASATGTGVSAGVSTNATAVGAGGTTKAGIDNLLNQKGQQQQSKFSNQNKMILGSGNFGTVVAHHTVTQQNHPNARPPTLQDKDSLLYSGITCDVLQMKQYCPFILQMYANIMGPKFTYFVTEPCVRSDLFVIVAERHRLPEQLVRLYFRQLCSALAFLHNKGIGHRDVSLENILLTDEPDDRCIRLMDFGMACNLYRKKTTFQSQSQSHQSQNQSGGGGGVQAATVTAQGMDNNNNYTGGGGMTNSYSGSQLNPKAPSVAKSKKLEDGSNFGAGPRRTLNQQSQSNRNPGYGSPQGPDSESYHEGLNNNNSGVHINHPEHTHNKNTITQYRDRNIDPSAPQWYDDYEDCLYSNGLVGKSLYRAPELYLAKDHNLALQNIAVVNYNANNKAGYNGQSSSSRSKRVQQQQEIINNNDNTDNSPNNNNMNNTSSKKNPSKSHGPANDETWMYRVAPIDVFCLGVCLFMALAGKPLWRRCVASDPICAFLAAGGSGEFTQNWMKLMRGWGIDEHLSGESLDLMTHMIRFDPESRSTVKLVRHHRWFCMK